LWQDRQVGRAAGFPNFIFCSRKKEEFLDNLLQPMMSRLILLFKLAVVETGCCDHLHWYHAVLRSTVVLILFLKYTYFFKSIFFVYFFPLNLIFVFVVVNVVAKTEAGSVAQCPNFFFCRREKEEFLDNMLQLINLRVIKLFKFAVVMT